MTQNYPRTRVLKCQENENHEHNCHGSVGSWFMINIQYIGTYVSSV